MHSLYRLQTIDIDIGHFRISLQTVANPDELYDQLIAKGTEHPDVRDERIPYWADLWHSAVALSRHLAEGLAIIRPGMQVTEIGCGLGLVGIMAGKLGADVAFTDYAADALSVARLNWALNLGQRPARFACMDWRDPDASLAADVVLAADVAYERRAFGPLMHTFHTLCRPGGCILLAEPGRSTGQEFLDLLSQNDFTLHHSQATETLRSIACRVNIVEIRKN
jgi:predicted nicotinamide N-methyase